MRDLYDCYFISARLPALKSRKTMTMADLARALREAAQRMCDATISEELAPLLPESRLAGLRDRLRAAAVRLAEWLEGS